MLVLMALGFGVISLFNSTYWAGWLLKDFTSFGACFLVLGFMGYIQMVIMRMVHTIGKRRNPNYTIS